MSIRTAKKELYISAISEAVRAHAWRPAGSQRIPVLRSPGDTPILAKILTRFPGNERLRQRIGTLYDSDAKNNGTFLRDTAWKIASPMISFRLIFARFAGKVKLAPIDSIGGRQRHQNTRLLDWGCNSIPIARSINLVDSAGQNASLASSGSARKSRGEHKKA